MQKTSKCCKIPTFLKAGMEMWAMTETRMKKVEDFEMWAYSRILRISWTHHIADEEVMHWIDREGDVGITIKKRKLEYIRHILSQQISDTSVNNPRKYTEQEGAQEKKPLLTPECFIYSAEEKSELS